MNHQETVILTRLVAAACPQQTIDEYTPDAWHDLLGDLTFADCQAAVVAIGKRQPFIAPCDIRNEVRVVVSERFQRTPIPAPPRELLDDPQAYIAHLRASATRIASGQPAAAIEAAR